jgi:hypothetical protein
VTGRIGDLVNPDGGAVVRLSLALSRGPLPRMNIQLSGQAAAGGGISLTNGKVTLGSVANPAVYRGAVTSLNGGQIDARLTSGAAPPLAVALSLRIDRSSGNVTGDANLVPASGR